MGRKENPIPAGDDASLSVGAKLRQLRHKHGVGLTALATQVGYSKPYLSAVENGTVHASEAIISAYSKVFDVSLEELDDDSTEWVAPAGNDDLPIDATVSRIADEFGLSTNEFELIREMLIDDARSKARALRASLDWWRESGPVPVCCIPVAGWQWREWPFDYIVSAIDRAASEAMQARIRELVIVLPPEKIAEMQRALRRPPFAERLQKITCVPQTAALGLGHAILQARTIIGARPFAIILPDDRFDRVGSDATLLRNLVNQASGSNHLIAVAKLKDHRRQYGVARLEPGNGRRGHRSVELLVEKPDSAHPVFRKEAAQDNATLYAVVGRYVLSPSIFPALARLGRDQGASARIELLDALQWLIDQEHESVAAYVLPSLVQLDRDQTVFVTSSPASPEGMQIA